MPAPRSIGPYEIVDLLGRGGMGEVYKAFDTRMYRRPVALKLLSEAMGADPRALSRFDQEIETAANLRHPNIVQIYDRGEHEGRRYFAMELLEGRDLTDVIKERDQRPLDARLDIIVQLCDALDYAHAHGVVHRDIKPANILVITRGATDHVKLVDFGIAHVARDDRTRTVVQPGTMLYMSPEQLQDEMVTPRSDLFSLGIVAFELCTGAHPFKARTEYLTSTNIMFEKHPPLRSLEPSAPEALETLVDRLLDKDRESRPASAAEVGAELKAIVRQLRAGSSDTEPPSFGNLDEMTGSMVERIVHWAKGKEAAGAIVEALEAYRRAILLAPDAPWLHSRVARIEEQLLQSPALDVQPEDDPGLRTSSRNRHREAFVRERLVEAGAALDEGDLDRASSIAAAILRQYHDEAQALALMDRIVMITDRGVPVKSYRKALRTAREALAQGDVHEAQRLREDAVTIWPDDDEVISLGREIETLRQVELAKAMSSCDELLGRAAEGAFDDDVAPAALAQAREALRRAEEMGAPAALVGEKRSALDRFASDVRARAEERAREALEAQEARRLEVTRLVDDAARRLSAAERAVSADATIAQAALADVGVAQDGIARANALGAASAETAELHARLSAAARALEDRIAREQARDREIAARLDAIRAGLAKVGELVAGTADDALRAGELLAAVDRDIAAVTADRPSGKELSGLRSTATGLRERLAEQRRAQAERQAREEQELRVREEKARLEQVARERQEKLERDQAAAKAERLRALLGRARAALREADDLSASIATEADLMAKPLAIARNAAREILEIEPGEPDATALLPKIEKLAKAADDHADEAARLRQQTERRRLDALAKRRAESLAARKRWLVIGGGAIVVAAVTIVGWQAYSGWRQRAEERSTDQVRIPVEREHTTPEPAKPPAGVESAAIGSTPPRPDEDLERKLATIGSDLGFAGGAPAGPVERIDQALGRADHGIRLAMELRKNRPSENRTQPMLEQLQITRSVLLQRRAALIQSASVEDGRKGGSEQELRTARGGIEKVVTQPSDDANARVGKSNPLPPPAVSAPVDTLRREVEAVVDEAKRQPLSSPTGVAARIALERQGLEKMARSGGQDWEPARRVELQSDLDTCLVWSLFYSFRDALVARNAQAILELYPRYPSAKAIAELREFQYSFDIVEVNVTAKTAAVRETTRGHQKPDFWDTPTTATRKYVLDRRADGSWFIVSGTLVR